MSRCGVGVTQSVLLWRVSRAMRGEYVLQQASQIARAAGAPLDKEHCVRPNLVIVVTSKPEALIKAWGDRRNAFGGVRGSLAKFSRFAGKPRPVRVWYNHDFGSGGDTSAVTKGSLQLGPAFADVPSSGCCLGSHFDVKDVLVFTSVAVIVDGKQVVGLQLTQLADFIAMVALTEIDLDASLGAAPTILRLFDARQNGAQQPAGLSAWDQEFLKWLYDFAAPLGSITQRSVITGEMLHDLAPRRGRPTVPYQPLRLKAAKRWLSWLMPRAAFSARCDGDRGARRVQLGHQFRTGQESGHSVTGMSQHWRASVRHRLDEFGVTWSPEVPA